VHGGLACYQESVDVVHQFGWKPIVKIQWWGLDLEPFLKFKKNPKASADTKIIGYVGRFIPEKGISDLLHMLSQLDSQYHMVIVGGGPEKADICRLVKELSLQDRVEFIPPQSRDELVKLYAAFDVLVLPSRTDYFWKEQYGRVLVEAMACGTLVAGSQSGAIPIVIGDPARCFPEGNIAVMRTIVQNLAQQSSDHKEQRRLKDRAHMGNVKHFVNAYIDLHYQVSQGKAR
jgi:glycosyltransferase involved in cell wall biosynthesis